MTKKTEKKVRRYIKTVLKNIELDGARFLINVLNKIFFFFFFWTSISVLMHYIENFLKNDGVLLKISFLNS